MKSVLFLCTANRFRSPFAAAVFQKLVDDDGQTAVWRIASAGTWAKPNLPVMPSLLEKEARYGINFAGHNSIEVNKNILAAYDLLIVMEQGHREALLVEFPEIRERVFLLSEIVDQIIYDVPDPAKNIDDADAIINELYKLIQRGYEKINNLAGEMVL